MSIPSFIHPINSVLNQPLHIEITVDTHANVRNNREKTRASLTQLPSVATACKTTVQPTIQIQSISIAPSSLVLAFYNHSHLFPFPAPLTP